VDSGYGGFSLLSSEGRTGWSGLGLGLEGSDEGFFPAPISRFQGGQ